MTHMEIARQRFIRNHFKSIWPVHIEEFTRFVTLLRGHFDGDLDLMLVTAVIGGQTQSSAWVSKLETFGSLTDDDEKKRHPTAINLQSIADYTGIPRETVRRKLKSLREKGWITKSSKGIIAVTPKAAQDLERATGDSIKYLAEMLKAFEGTGLKRQ